MKALSFLEAVAGFAQAAPGTSADRPVKLATVDATYDPLVDWPDQPPPARVTFEGETTLSTKAYPIASGIIPFPEQRVFLIPQGNSYLIAGILGAHHAQGFWSTEDGADAGVELGGGSYYSTDDGLVLAGDAAISGDVTFGSTGLRAAEIQAGSVSITKGVAAGAQSQAVTYPVAWPGGTTVRVMLNIETSAGGLPFVFARATAVTNTGFTIAILKSDAAQANFTLSAFPVDWVAFATP